MSKIYALNGMIRQVTCAECRNLPPSGLTETIALLTAYRGILINEQDRRCAAEEQKIRREAAQNAESERDKAEIARMTNLQRI